MKKSIAAFSLSLSVFSTSGIPLYAQQQKPTPSKPVVVVTEMKQTSPKAVPDTREENGSGRQQKPITNADIIRMVKAGFGESIIINHIQTNQTQFDVSLNALFELKNSGVSQKVIEAMQFVAAAQAAGSRQPPQKLPNQPLPQQQSSSQPSPDQRPALPPQLASYGQQFYALLVQADNKRLLQIAAPQIVETKTKNGDLTLIAKDTAVTAAISGATTRAAGAAAASAAGSSIPVVGGIIAGGMMAGNLFRKKPTATYVTAIGGQSSAVVTQTGIPKFEVVYGNVAGVDPEEYEPAIIRLVPTLDNWRLVYAKKGRQGNPYPTMEGKFYSDLTEERVAVKSVRLGRGDVQIEAEKPLEAGEYAVVLRPVSREKAFSMKNTGDMSAFWLLRAIWDFTIKNPSGSGQNSPAAQNPASASTASAAAKAAQSQPVGSNSQQLPVEAMQATITSSESNGVTLSIKGAYDRAFEAALNFLKKQGNTIESASKETGQISTALTVSGSYRQTGSRTQLTFIKEGGASLTMRIAVVEQKRYKALKTEPWGEAKVSQEKSGKAAGEILLMLNAAQ